MTHNPSQERLGAYYHIVYSDDRVVPVLVKVIEPWEIHHLDLTGTEINDCGEIRTIAAGPDKTGLVMFDDFSEAYLFCPHFEGQRGTNQHAEVWKKDRVAHEESGHIRPAPTHRW